MTLGLNNLKISAGSKKNRRRVGRGNASGRGTYSSRGQKGQRSRSGGRRGLKRRGLKNFLRNKPKIGGFRSQQAKLLTVDLDQLEKVFEAGEVITPKKLLTKNLLRTIKPGVKILGSGQLTKKFTVVADAFSESAEKAIIEAGGKIIRRPRGQSFKSRKN